MLRFSVLAAIAKLLLGSALAAPNVVIVESGDTPASWQKGKLPAESTLLENFHLSPMPEATRAAVLTGQHEFRCGLGDRQTGRSRLRPGIPTLPEMFRAAGYRTALIGSWGLGEAYPCRPEDRGFDDLVIHGGGLIGCTPDYWGNGPGSLAGLRRKSGWEKATGSAAEVFTAEAGRWLDERIAAKEPFLLYLATGEYSGAWPALLAKLPGDTIVVVLSKPAVTPAFQEVDTRQACAIRWPGKIPGGKKVAGLSSPLDLLPTLTHLCEVEKPQGWTGDGIDLSGAIQGKAKIPADRLLFTQLGNWRSDEAAGRFRGKDFAVQDARWRLSGVELTDLASDEPGKNVFSEHPQEMQRLLTEYGRWWTSVLPALREPVRYVIGAEEAPKIQLTAYDWWPSRESGAEGAGAVISQDFIRKFLQDAQVAKTRNELPSTSGHWRLEAAREGSYEILFSLLPPEASAEERRALSLLRKGIAHLRAGQEELRLEIQEGASGFQVPMDLEAGPVELEIWFDGQLLNDRIAGAFFGSIEYKGPRKAPKTELKPKARK